MAQQSILDLILNIRKRGTGAKDAEKEMRNLKTASSDAGKAAERLSLGYMAVQGALITAGVQFIRSVPALIDQGIAIERTNTALEAYAGGGVEAQLATEAILDATDGAISNFDAASNATKFFSMGLAENADEAGRLAEIAVTMGAAVGKDAKSSFEEFSLLLANTSIQRLDQFGLSAGQVRLRMAELQDEQAGLTRQTAFVNAVMELGEEKLKLLDDAGFTAVSSMDRLRASFSNLKDEIAKVLARGFVPIIDGALGVVDAVGQHKQAILETSTSYEQYLSSMREARRENPLQVLGFLSMSEAAYGEAKALEAAKEAAREKLMANGELSDSYSSVVLASEDAKEQLEELSLLMKTDLSGSMEAIKEKVQDQQKQIGEWQARVNEISSSPYVTPEQMSEMQGLQEKIGEAEQKVADLQEQWDEQTKRMIFNIAQQKLAIDGFTQEEIDALARLAGPDGFGLVDKAGEELISRIGGASLELAKMGDQSNIFVDQMRGLQGAVGDASQDVGGLEDRINALPIRKQVTLVTRVRNIFENFTYNNVITQKSYGKGFQHGGQFTIQGRPGPDQVPVGFMGSQGETVTVTPRGGLTPSEKGQSGGGDRPINVSVYNRFDLSLLEQVLRGR